jgi:hypothetical protein
MDLLTEAITLRYEEEGPLLLAQEFGVSANSVVKRARRRGLSSKHGRRRQADSHTENNRNVNVKYFDSVGFSQAYILGYIWGDGTVVWNEEIGEYRLQFACQLKDRELLEQVKSELQVKSEIYYCFQKEKRAGRKDQRRWCLSVNSKRLIRPILGRGFIPNKSFVDPSHPLIEDEVYGHFLRGILDSDGTVGKNGRVEYLGSHIFINTLRDRLVSLLGITPFNPTTSSGTEKVSRIGWNSKSDTQILRDFMYPQGVTLYLGRKKRRLDSRFIDMQI